ncbi:MAG: hypothetical protein AVDCRST_MAG09-434, partial [uncultured Sphingomonas sp.]
WTSTSCSRPNPTTRWRCSPSRTLARCRRTSWMPASKRLARRSSAPAPTWPKPPGTGPWPMRCSSA